MEEIVSRREAKANGLTRYFTGKPCANGHVCKRRVTDHQCLSCVKARQKKRLVSNPEALARHRARNFRWRSKNKERLRFYYAEWAARNRDKIKDYHQAWRRANRVKWSNYGRTWKDRNPALNRATIKAWRVRNRERVLATDRKWRAANLSIVRGYIAAWGKANPEIRRAHGAAYRAKKKLAEGRWNATDIRWLRSIQRGRCAHAWCRVSLSEGFHVDHILPLALGGSNARSNLQLLCPTCNCQKGAKHPVDFALRNGLLV